MKTSRAIPLVVQIGVPAAAVVAWAAWSSAAGSIYFPSLTKIVTAFQQTWLFDRFSSDLLPSLARVGVGYFIGCLLGVVVGFFLGRARLLREITAPVLHFARAVPAPALLPFMMVVFGLGNGMKIGLIAFGTFFPVLLSTLDGVRSVEPTYLDAARSYGINRRDRILRILLPASLPQIMAGMRTSLALALILIVISEMVASTSGIGYFVLQAQRTFQLPEMWGAMLLLGLLGITINAVFVLVERRALRWYRGSRATADQQ